LVKYSKQIINQFDVYFPEKSHTCKRLINKKIKQEETL